MTTSPSRSRLRRRHAVVATGLVLLLAGCSDDAASEDRDAEALYEDAFEAPAELEIINVPEDALRPTLTAVWPGDEVDTPLDAIEEALETAGWDELSRSGADENMGGIIATRGGDEDLQVEAIAGDQMVSVRFIFAAPGEGL